MRQALLDIDTQIDFVFPAGALYVPGAVKLIPTLAALNRFASSHSIPLISTACAHFENDPEFQSWPPHCILGTIGQQKPAELLVGQRIFEKQQTDLFQSPEADELIGPFDHFTVYGVATEVCVQFAAFGLLARGKQVMVVEDAIAGIDPHRIQIFKQQLLERGGRLTTSQHIFHSTGSLA